MTGMADRAGPGGSDGIVRQLRSRSVYENRWMTVREDEVIRPDGSTGQYGVVDKPDFALIVPAQAGGFYLVEQYRYPVGGRFWEFPQGSWPAGAPDRADAGPAGPGGPPPAMFALARAELAEETGLRAGALTYLGRIQVAPGYSSQGCFVFLAEQLTTGEPDREAPELDMVHGWVGRSELEQMIRDGRFVDAASLAALSLLQRRIDSREQGGER